MRTSFRDIVLTEQYLNGKMAGEEAAVFQARLLVDRALKQDMIFHRLLHRLVQLYHRKKLRQEIHSVHQHLFRAHSNDTFQNSIRKIFNS